MYPGYYYNNNNYYFLTTSEKSSKDLQVSTPGKKPWERLIITPKKFGILPVYKDKIQRIILKCYNFILKYF